MIIIVAMMMIIAKDMKEKMKIVRVVISMMIRVNPLDHERSAQVCWRNNSDVNDDHVDNDDLMIMMMILTIVKK